MSKMGGRESVAEEVARVRGLASQLQILLQHNSPRGAGELSEELLQSLTAALSVLNPDKDKPFSFQRPAATMLNSSSSSYTMKRENKERNCLGSQLQSSRNPISRCYYKCTYADEQECPATKQVEQKNWNDPPMFEVSYDKQHTCKIKFILPKLAMDEGILNTTPDQLSFSAYSIPTRMYQSTSNEHGHTGYPDLSCAGSPNPEGQQALDRCAVSPDSEGQQTLNHDMELLRALLFPNPDFSLACL